jgi:hypothetical protein
MNARIGGRAGLVGLGLGVVGVVLLLVSYFMDARQFFFSYLTAYAWALTIALGALILLAIAHASGARWFVAIRPLAESCASSLPIFAVLFLPVALGIPALFAWVDPSTLPAHDRHLVEEKTAYLNVPFFLVRAVVYFVVWSGLALFLQRWSERMTPDTALALRGRQRLTSALGLVALAFTVTFAAFDWIMSLEPAWFSTSIGVYLFSGAMVGALSAMAILFHLVGRGVLADVLNEGHLRAVGKLLFTFVVFWAYIAYTQFYIIWIADIPELTSWYRHRMTGTWWHYAGVLAVGHFAIPFAILLSRNVKRRSGPMAVIGAWLLLMHFLDVHWLVMPVLHTDGFRPHLADFAAALAVGGLAFAFGAWRATRRDLASRHDPFFAYSIRYEGT